jgi:hypothetical protein
VSASLVALGVADPASAWAGLGFEVIEGAFEAGDVRVVLGQPGKGIVSWTLGGLDARDLDGLTTLSGTVAESARKPLTVQPNGVTGIDHVVVVTPDFDRTARALDEAGLTLRRVRDAGGFRQGFRRLGPTIMEIVEAAQVPAGPARFWGLTFTVADLDGLRRRLPVVSEIRDAVQPGRRIATLRREAGVSTRVAFITPE